MGTIDDAIRAAVRCTKCGAKGYGTCSCWGRLANSGSVIVCGGRDFTDRETVFAVLDAMHAAGRFTVLRHGAAPGADSFAGEWAGERGVDCIPYPAKWREHGRAAGPIRNQQMIEDSSAYLVIAFPGGRGTADMIRRARKAGIHVHEVRA